MTTTQALLIPRDRILAATVELVLKEGVNAATTRAVAFAAGVQAPAIYRLFGDKDGLLEAAAEYALSSYIKRKLEAGSPADAVQALRQGWDTHLEFALTHREIYRMILSMEAMGGTVASRRGVEVLRGKIEAVAASGRLRLPVEQALDLFHAMASGTIIRLLGQEQGPGSLLWENAREAAIAAIIVEPIAPETSMQRTAAISLQAGLSEFEGLSAGERLLMEELLQRIAESG